jgi:hypothetical protein
MHRSICLSSWSIQKKLPQFRTIHASARQFHVSKQTPKMLLVDQDSVPSPDGYRWISMSQIDPNGKVVMTWGPVRCTKSLGFLWHMYPVHISFDISIIHT